MYLDDRKYRIYALENDIKSYERAIKRKEMLQKLENNSDFVELIHNDFCLKTMEGYLATSINPRISEAARKDALGMAQAAMYLKRFFNNIFTEGRNAEERIEETKQELHEALTETESE